MALQYPLIICSIAPARMLLSVKSLFSLRNLVSLNSSFLSQRICLRHIETGDGFGHSNNSEMQMNDSNSRPKFLTQPTHCKMWAGPSITRIKASSMFRVDSRRSTRLCRWRVWCGHSKRGEMDPCRCTKGPSCLYHVYLLLNCFCIFRCSIFFFFFLTCFHQVSHKLV